jgi:hypothetical protein
MKAVRAMKAAKSKKTTKRTTSPAARRARPITRAQKSLADVTRYKTDMETRRARLSDEMRRGRAGAEVRLLAFPRLKFFLVTEPHATTLLDALRAHLDEDIARADRVIEALQPGRAMTSEQADELKSVLARIRNSKPR